MAIGRDVFLEILKDAYSAYYSLEAAGEEEAPLSFRAIYHSRDEQYFLAKSANIWGNEKNEYCFVFSAPGFTAEEAEKLIDRALEEMLPRVRPHKEHQYTNCKVIFVADSLEDGVIDAIRRRRFSKSYGPLSLKGYTELITCAVDLSREKAFPNRVGHDLESFFGKLFALRREEA